MEKNYEIERKFLVKYLPEDLEQYTCHDIVQAYISTDPTIRIRKLDESYILTVKSSGLIKRQEYEMEITAGQFEKLKGKTEGYTIAKKRYIIPLEDGLKAELDVYYEDLAGFMNVEVEFPDMKKAVLFTPPDWFGQEVTQDKRYTNGSMSKYGVPKN